MSLKKIEQVKTDKWFKIWDLLVYGILIASVVALICAFAFAGKGAALDGFSINYKGEQVLTYSFSDDAPNVLSPENITVDENTAQKLLITFYTADKSGYNKIEVDKVAKTVRVTGSNCSTHKDCVYTPAVSGTRSVPIICTPHSMSITPFTVIDDGNIII